MDNSYTSNEFLFSFEGRINRAKYWYAVFASSAFCGVLLGVWAFVLGRIFGASIKSVHLNFLDIAPFSVTFSDAGPGLTENLISLLFYAGGTPIVVFGMWFLAATTVKRLHDRDKRGCSGNIQSACGPASRYLCGGRPRTRRIRSLPLGLCRAALLERDETAQSVRA